jgi:hypothetical protein
MRFVSNVFVSACAVALLSLAAIASAEETQQPPPATEGQTTAPAEPAADPAAPAENPDEVICKKLPSETGTRLGKNRKECHTRREWNQIAEESKRSTQDAQHKN